MSGTLESILAWATAGIVVLWALSGLLVAAALGWGSYRAWCQSRTRAGRRKRACPWSRGLDWMVR